MELPEECQTQIPAAPCLVDLVPGVDSLMANQTEAG
jgi:hypothetical protein